MTPDVRSLGAEARKAVLRQLLTAAKAWSALEERYRADGKSDDADDAHQHGVWVLRAYAAEADDPLPYRRQT